MVKEYRGKINYDLWYKIEDKYGEMSNCPEDDEDLKQLRREMNLPEEGISKARDNRLARERILKEDKGGEVNE